MKAALVFGVVMIATSATLPAPARADENRVAGARMEQFCSAECWRVDPVSGSSEFERIVENWGFESPRQVFSSLRAVCPAPNALVQRRLIHVWGFTTYELVPAKPRNSCQPVNPNVPASEAAGGGTPLWG